MWIASKYGFYSITQKEPSDDGEPAVYQVRARLRGDLENLLAASGLGAEILEWPDADYRYRVLISQRELFDLMCLLAESLDYPNFKAMIAETPGQCQKLGAYHEVWRTMAAV